MNSRPRAATLILIAVLVVVGIVATLESWSPVASLAPLGITGIIGVGTILALGRHAPATPTVPGEVDQLVGLRPKGALTTDEWMGMLSAARSELYIAGHSLGTWCDTDNRDRFTTELARILHRGTVTLVILHPESQALARLYRATSTNYAANVLHSLQILEAFIRLLPVKDRTRMTITLLEDPLSLPYMVVGNEHTLITATYLATRHSDQMPCFKLDRDSDGARAIYNDLHKLAELGEKVPI
jgi:hypothetical protein